jgi:hypothetical protein
MCLRKRVESWLPLVAASYDGHGAAGATDPGS